MLYLNIIDSTNLANMSEDANYGTKGLRYLKSKELGQGMCI